jgi:hypothetical protein
MPMTLEQCEQALDSGRLHIQWHNGKWYTVRRNGQTKRWKRDPSRFRIPCKTGFKDTFVIARDWGDLGPSGGHYLDSPYLRIA